MEGLCDFPMRAMLTQVGGFDWCVTEFLRITDRLLPRRSIIERCPEALSQWCTPSGTPVHLQLLGSDPVALAENAALAASLGAPAIDLNFGCPARTVNRHRGGAVLLDEPERIFRILQEVRAAVPTHVPVSAKMRLGVENTDRMLDNARAVEDAGASWLTVHARTKAQGYRPPAHWPLLAEIRSAIRLPIIANGDIWSEEDAQRCRQQSGCEDLMLGRGAVIRPDLARRLKTTSPPLTWRQMLLLQQSFLQSMLPFGNGRVARYKQWLGLLTQSYEEATELFAVVRTVKEVELIEGILTDRLA